MVYETPEGGTVTLTPVGWDSVDIHYRDAAGETVASLIKPRPEALLLVASLSRRGQ